MTSNRKEAASLISADSVADCIYTIHGHKAMLDIDLAALYQVPVKRLKEQVNRNIDQFPADFMFRLTVEETHAIFHSRSQNATMKWGRNIKYGSYAFTEEGVSMLSGVLRSPRAVEVHIAIMRAFVRMRRILSENQDLAKKLEELENKLIAHDDQIADIVKAIRQMMFLPEHPKPKIGYRP